MRHLQTFSPPFRSHARAPARRILVLACLLACGTVWAQQAPDRQTQAQTPSAGSAADDAAKKEDASKTSLDKNTLDKIPLDKIPLEEIRRYVNVYNVVKQAYVEPIDDRKLMQSAVRGLLLDLDPHSAYLVKQAADAFTEDSDGAYDGIGVEVQQQPDGTILVVSPIDDTPAAKAGVKSGDIITAVDGKALTPEVADGNPLRGAPGSKTVLTIQREGAAKPLLITVQRETIRISSVRSRMLEPEYGYIRVSAFQADTAKEFSSQLQRLQSQSAGAKGLRGLVLDLRTNPGGLLTSAVQIADDLLDKGKIVSTRGRVSLGDAEFNATPGDLMRGAPVAVLIDAGSASASEVLAAALRDNQRAVLVGSRTFGKGSVQTVLPLDNGDSVKLTTARYYTPSGKSIQARGIDPDVLLKPDANVKGVRSDISESVLPGHLRGDQEGVGIGNGDVLEGDGPIAAALLQLKKPVALAAPVPATSKR